MTSIALHAPCLVQAHRPQLLRAMVRVGEALGLEQAIPAGQTCCGLPVWEAGYEDAAREAAQHTLERLGHASAVATPSTACHAMLHHHMPGLMAATPQGEDARALAASTVTWCSLLLPHRERFWDQARFQGRVILLDVCDAGPCQACQILLSGISGLTLVHSPVPCCSFSFELSSRYPDIAASIAEAAAQPLVRSRVDAVLVHEPGCLWRLQPHFTDAAVPRLLHPAEFFAAIID